MIEGRFDVIGAHGPKTFFEHLSPQGLAHAYLFSGEDGVGKKTFALRLAQSLLCETPKQTLLGYCGACRACTRIESGTHPDLLISAGSVKIGERDGGAGFHETAETTARDLVRHLSLHSYAGGRRIFILGDVDFTREAANALLKFFEETPEGVLLIVTTSAPGRLLATIRSRLVEIAFPPLVNEEIVAILERHGVEAEEARKAAGGARGSAARALHFLEQGEADLRGAVLEWFYETVRGRSTDSSWATRVTLEEGLDIAKSLTRDRLALRVAGDDAPILTPDQRAALKKLPQRDPQALLDVLAALGEAQKLARTNVSPALVADYARIALATRG
jgi:DNA polymerase III delta prime subunit